MNKHVIVLYHGIVERIMDPHLDRYCITKAQFQKHIDFLSKKFRFVSLGELIPILKNKEPEKKPCAVLTFDDAFENVYLTAYPVLLEKKIPFVVAIPTGLIDTKRSLWGPEIDLMVMRTPHPEISFFSNNEDRTLRLSLRSGEERLAAAIRLRRRAMSSKNGDCYRFVTDLIREYGEQDFHQLLEDYPHLRIMSSRQLREMVSNGMEPACHGFYHNRLDTDNEDIIRQEVLRSKAHLQERLSLADVKHYILPHGKFSDKTLSEIRHAGFSSCLTTKNRPVEPVADLYRLPRVKGHAKLKDFVWGLTK
jgi:peptidoglycan/xylan/chitin deacetylase (PgdA/CDA1 family)